MRILVAVREDGTEEMFNSEIAPRLHAVLCLGGDLLVVQTDPLDARRAIVERNVPLVALP